MITLIDNYDSFTYNLYHCLSKRDQVLVIKNDMILKNIDKKTRICISLMYTILLKLYHEGSVWPIYLPVFLYLYIAHFLKIMDI